MTLHEDGRPTTTFWGIMAANAGGIILLVFTVGVQFQKINALEAAALETKAQSVQLRDSQAISRTDSALLAQRLAAIETQSNRIETLLTQFLETEAYYHPEIMRKQRK